MSKVGQSGILNIITRLAPQIGAQVQVEPEWRMAGRIVFASGKVSYFKKSVLDLNPLAACKIANDKGYANFFMGSLGYPVVPNSRTFFSEAFAAHLGVPARGPGGALDYADEIGHPVITKPNRGSQGRNVFLNRTKEETRESLDRILHQSKVAVVESALTGTDLRIVVLDDEVLSAYQRLPLALEGNGHSSVEELFAAKKSSLEACGRGLEIDFGDARIQRQLKEQRIAPASILPWGQPVTLLANANLSTGGEAIDCTSTIHAEYKRLAISITCDMGLRFCGVDLMLQGDHTLPSQNYWILEVNSAPGLNHYIKRGSAQEADVDQMYLKLLKRIEARPGL